MKGIAELDTIHTLEVLSEAYERSFGLPPFHLSHWNPSDSISAKMMGHLDLPPPPESALSYIYPYDTGLEVSTAQRLGFSPADRQCIIVPNGTSSIVFAAAWLKMMGVSTLMVVCPAYFPVFYACDLLGIKVVKVYMHRQDGNWCLPVEVLSPTTDSTTAVWITNPVYCTGVYLNESDKQAIEILASRRVVILDECLAETALQCSPKIQSSPKLLTLSSPHKAICLNAVKFAAVVFDPVHGPFFDEWSDVLIGGLSASTVCAVQHFLGDNYSQYAAAFVQHLSVARNYVIDSMKSTPVALDPNTTGYFLTCYVPSLEDLGADELRRFVFETGAVVIPGSRNHFPKSVGFNFRINLARDCPQFRSAVQRVRRFISDQLP